MRWPKIWLQIYFYESNLHFVNNYEGQGTAKVTTRVKWKRQSHNIEYTSRHENKKFLEN